jgi:dephospho-CoA kinase
MPFKVIGLVGLQGAGKTEVARILGELGVPRVRMGDVVWEELRLRGEEITEENVARLANELRQREGMDAIAKRCVPLLRKKGENAKAVVVDGIRGIAEVEEFRRAFGQSFNLWGVWARKSIRYKRIAERKREDDALGPERFDEKDRRELGWGMGEALALADELIVNEGTLDELRARVTELFRRVVG